MTPLRRIKLTKLNQHLVCPLCSGYFVEATTITECLHTFCKTCIVRYLNSSSFCPVCDVQVHKTKPTSGLREDKTLQDVVFKLVPDLFRNEMDRRAYFYKEHPEAGGDKTEQSLKERRHFFHVDDQISLSLEFLPPAHAHAHALGLRPLRGPSLCLSHLPNNEERKNGNKEKHNSTNKSPEMGDDRRVEEKGGLTRGDDEESQEKEPKIEIPIRRYLKCPAAVQIRLLEKFIRLKYGLSAHHRVDIVHGGDCLSPELTLLDVVYMYKWTEDNPLNLQYTVIAPPLPLRKRPRSSGISKFRASCQESSPKKMKISKGSSQVSPEKCKPNNTESNVNQLSSTNKKEKKIEKLPSYDIANKEGTENSTDTTSLECANSLNSSRDEADDAMVIDEDISDSSNVVEIGNLDLSQVGKIETHKCVAPSLSNNSKLQTCVQQEFCSPLASSDTLSSIHKGNTPLSQKSSIESLKALVNNSSYSGFPSNPTQIKLSSSSTVSSNNHSLNPESHNLQTLKPENHSITSITEKTDETHVPAASETKMPNASVACSTSDTPGPSEITFKLDNSAGISNVSGKPEIMNTISKSEGAGATANPISIPSDSNISISLAITSSAINSNISHMQMTAARSTSFCTSVNVNKSESPRISQSNGRLLNAKTSSSSDSFLPDKVNEANNIPLSIPHTNVPTLSSVSGAPVIPSKSASLSRSASSVSRFNQMLHVPRTTGGSNPVTPASTSLTPALKTPLASSTPSSSQSFPITAVTDSSIAHKPSQPPAPRSLISNSYRSSLPLNNGLKVNGMISAPRPILDPTKPRLGRPPNSARIAAAAAGRVGPQPILPRGATPREIFNDKAVSGLKCEGRGRPKGQNVAGSGRGLVNHLLVPQQPILTVGKNMSISKTNNQSHVPQNIMESTSVASREPQTTIVDNPVSNISGMVSQHFTKNVLPNNNNNNARETKEVSSLSNSVNNVSNVMNKIQKKMAPEQTTSSPAGKLQKSLTNNSLKGNVSPQTKLHPVSSVSAVKTVRSPNRTKTSNGNSSSILSIAQNLANKQLQQQISHADSVLSTGCVTTGSSAISSATVAAAAAAAAAAASLGPQFNAALGLSSVPPALCAYMAANYNTAMQNILLSQAARTALNQATSLQDPSKKLDSGPMDLSPSNKTSQVSNVTSNQIIKVKGSSSSSKKSQLAKTAPLLSPQNSLPHSSSSVLSPKSSKSSLDPRSALQTATISPPTPEVTITKLPNTPLENPSTSASSSSTTKPSHTNTVSITKRPSVTSSSSSTNGVTTPKFGVTRSPSNASVRQIPNPSHLSHQSEVRNSSSHKGNKITNSSLPSAVTNNNNSNKNNNKPLKIEL